MSFTVSNKKLSHQFFYLTRASHKDILLIYYGIKECKT